MRKFVAVVECAIQLEDKFLFIKRPLGVHAGGLLAFPGGKVKPEDGNSLEVAIKREVLEEVGLDLVDPIEFITRSHFVDSDGNHVIDTIFYCDLIKTNKEIKASPREAPEYFWLTPSELNAHPSAPVWLKRYIQCVLTASKSAIGQVHPKNQDNKENEFISLTEH